MTNIYGDTFEEKEYVAFMYNRDNEFNCGACPENDGKDGRLPCGQQNCWVTCHCCAEE